MKFVFTLFVVLMFAAVSMAADSTAEKSNSVSFGAGFNGEVTPTIGYAKKVTGDVWVLNYYDFGETNEKNLPASQSKSLSNEFVYFFGFDFLGVDFMKNWKVGPLVGSNIDINAPKTTSEGIEFNVTDWIAATGVAFDIPVWQGFDASGYWKYKYDLAKDNTYDKNSRFGLAVARKF